MRKLTGQQEPEAGAQKEEAKQAEGRPEGVKNWLPYTGPGCLEEAKYTTKNRLYKDTDGTMKNCPEVVVKEEGTPRYSVEGNDLIEWRKGRGGTKRRHVRTFKARFPDTKEGKEAKSRQASFRAMLRSKKIPGA